MNVPQPRRAELQAIAVAAGVALLFATSPKPALMLVALAAILLASKYGTAVAGSVMAAMYGAFPPYIGVEAGGVVIFWQRVLLFALSALVGASLLFNQIERQRAEETLDDRIGRRVFLLLAFMFAWRLMAEIVARDMRGLLAAANEVVVLFGMCATAVALWRRPREQHLIATGIVIAAIAVSLFAVAEFVTAENPLAKYAPVRRDMVSASEQLSRFGQIRATATLGQPLAVAQLLLLGMGLLVTLPLSGMSRVFHWAGQLVLFAGIMATGTRSAVVSLLAGLAVVAVRSLKSIALLSFAAAAVLMQPFVFREQIAGIARHIEVAIQPDLAKLSTVSGEEMASRISALSRLAQIAVSADVLAQNPAMGVGSLNVKAATGLRTIDNYYLLTALESGLPSLFAFLTLCGASLWAAVRLRRNGAVERGNGYLFAVASTMSMLAFVSLKVVMPLIFITLGLVLGSALPSVDRESTGDRR